MLKIKKIKLPLL